MTKYGIWHHGDFKRDVRVGPGWLQDNGTTFLRNSREETHEKLVWYQRTFPDVKYHTKQYVPKKDQQ